ncbi:hypothetical protein EAG_15988 [Camponotus floridanus]|uniref:Uncharacterized protein n=1 Tax=Camponotus floridanus TaxID=104421 RepID=E2A344_CAMFO|nr:hypothetical protein EAG_15988 [Camponotus floridanus]
MDTTRVIARVSTFLIRVLLFDQHRYPEKPSTISTIVSTAVILQTGFLAAFQDARSNIRRSGITAQIYETMHMDGSCERTVSERRFVFSTPTDQLATSVEEKRAPPLWRISRRMTLSSALDPNKQVIVVPPLPDVSPPFRLLHLFAKTRTVHDRRNERRPINDDSIIDRFGSSCLSEQNVLSLTVPQQGLNEISHSMASEERSSAIIINAKRDIDKINLENDWINFILIAI